MVKESLKLSGLVSGANINPTGQKTSGLASSTFGFGLPSHGKNRLDNGTETAILVSLELVCRSPFQNRSRVAQDEINLLAEDIRRDGLRNPIILRPIADDQYELVSGETRMEAFRTLGRTEIPAFIRNMDDKEAARGTVLDNFFHRDLADYEIYKGLKILSDCGVATSLAQLSSMTKWGRTHVHRFMSFGKLPQDALDILEVSPSLFSAKIAGDFAKLISDGMPEDLVASALRLVAAEKLDPHKSAKWAEKKWLKGSDASASDDFAFSGSGKQAVVLPSGKLAYTISKTPKGLVVAGEKGIKIDWDALESDLAEWLSKRVSVEFSE